jgi:membrane-bound lytic murein transglycosylase D
MWQFMGSRAKGYGLQRNFWVDERQDPEKSTRAAARHLKDLYTQFGDWYLAMAAYNSGPGRVQSAVKRTGYADFWELYRRNVLPKETRNYVPIIVAVTIMAKNPEQYGLDDVNLDKPIPYDAVKINYPIDLRLAAECVDATATDLQDLNPSLLRLTTPKDREFELRLPAGSKEKFMSAVAAIPADKRLWWRYHKVQNGETLASLAKMYHTTATAISQANKLEDASLEPESRVVIPIAPGKYSDTGTYARRITRYKVRRGDTVETVAENFAVPVRMVRGWNHLKGNSLAGRRVLYLHLPVTPGAPGYEVASKSKLPKKTAKPAVKAEAASANAGVVQHKVRQGETLYSIASSYKTTVAALQRYNRNTATLRPGMILVVRDTH